jgi:hypothetical protein
MYSSLEKGSLVISKQPQPAECSFGDSVSFEIEAESFELLSYQWYKDDEKLLGTISFSFSFLPSYDLAPPPPHHYFVEA